MIQNFRDFHQLMQIDAFPIKHLINIGFFTVDFLREPIDRSALTHQLIMDHLAHVNIFHDKFHNISD